MAERKTKSIEDLEIMLAGACEDLDEAAKAIRDFDINRKINIRKIGESLANLYEIRQDIYSLRPDLTPDILK